MDSPLRLSSASAPLATWEPPAKIVLLVMRDLVMDLISEPVFLFNREPLSALEPESFLLRLTMEDVANARTTLRAPTAISALLTRSTWPRLTLRAASLASALALLRIASLLPILAQRLKSTMAVETVTSWHLPPLTLASRIPLPLQDTSRDQPSNSAHSTSPMDKLSTGRCLRNSLETRSQPTEELLHSASDSQEKDQPTRTRMSSSEETTSLCNTHTAELSIPTGRTPSRSSCSKTNGNVWMVNRLLVSIF